MTDGELKHPVGDVEHVIPWMLLHLPVDLAALDEPTLIMFAEASEKAASMTP